MNRPTVVVIGGGASGLLAAGTAAENGAKVILLEKMPRPGRKILLTGNRRCNLTNSSSVNDFITHFGKNGRFLKPAFTAFFSEDLKKLLKHLGVPTIAEPDGRIFTASGNSADVVDALIAWADSERVYMISDTSATKLHIENNAIIDVEIFSRKTSRTSILKADSVIIATGGKSYPATGSTGDGYHLAEEVGHTIIPIYPAIVPLIAKGDIPAKLQGLSLEKAKVRLFVDNKKQAEQTLPVMFTSYGLSGPAVLNMSKAAVQALNNKHKVEIVIDLLPEHDHAKLDKYFIDTIKEHGSRHFKSFLGELLPPKLIDAFLALTEIPSDILVNQLTAAQRKRLINLLKDFRFEIISHRDFNEAVITCGGVSLREIDPNTLESKIIRGLFFAGEVMDIDADTGGYNLQAAFSTGFLAGKSAARR